MKATRQVLSEMRQAADAMSPKSGVRSALDKWHSRLAEALEQDARATESASQPRSARTQYDESVHGIYDVRGVQERRTYGLGRLQNVYTRKQVERRSRKPWGTYPDLPGVAVHPVANPTRPEDSVDAQSARRNLGVKP